MGIPQSGYIYMVKSSFQFTVPVADPLDAKYALREHTQEDRDTRFQSVGVRLLYTFV